MTGFVLHYILKILVPSIVLQMFSSIGQSPCDVAAELASVCIGTSVFASFLSVFCVVRTGGKKSSIYRGPTPCWIYIFRTYRDQCKQLQVQLSFLLVDERLCVLSKRTVS